MSFSHTLRGHPVTVTTRIEQVVLERIASRLALRNPLPPKPRLLVDQRLGYLLGSFETELFRSLIKRRFNPECGLVRNNHCYDCWPRLVKRQVH